MKQRLSNRMRGQRVGREVPQPFLEVLLQPFLLGSTEDTALAQVKRWFTRKQTCISMEPKALL